MDFKILKKWTFLPLMTMVNYEHEFTTNKLSTCHIHHLGTSFLLLVRYNFYYLHHSSLSHVAFSYVIPIFTFLHSFVLNLPICTYKCQHIAKLIYNQWRQFHQIRLEEARVLKKEDWTTTWMLNNTKQIGNIVRCSCSWNAKK